MLLFFFFFFLEIGKKSSYSNLAFWAKGPKDQVPNDCKFMYKFVNLVFFYLLFLLNFSIVCRFWIFCYWFCGLASLRLIFKKSSLPLIAAYRDLDNMDSSRLMYWGSNILISLDIVKIKLGKWSSNNNSTYA